MCNKTDECTCIGEILTVILILQKNASCCGDSCLDTCDRGFLGCGNATIGCNTRPVMLYTCAGNGTAFSMGISKDPSVVTTSNVFRIEKIDGNCATFRVLVPNTESGVVNSDYAATNSFFTMNLDCVCAVRCLNDTYVDCI